MISTVKSDVWLYVSTDQSPCVPCGSSAATQEEGVLGGWRFRVEYWEKHFGAVLVTDRNHNLHSVHVYILVQGPE